MANFANKDKTITFVETLAKDEIFFLGYTIFVVGIGNFCRSRRLVAPSVK
jgi:hypothetical protein